MWRRIQKNKRKETKNGERSYSSTNTFGVTCMNLLHSSSRLWLSSSPSLSPSARDKPVKCVCVLRPFIHQRSANKKSRCTACCLRVVFMCAQNRNASTIIIIIGEDGDSNRWNGIIHVQQNFKCNKFCADSPMNDEVATYIQLYIMVQWPMKFGIFVSLLSFCTWYVSQRH